MKLRFPSSVNIITALKFSTTLKILGFLMIIVTLSSMISIAFKEYRQHQTLLAWEENFQDKIYLSIFGYLSTGDTFLLHKAKKNVPESLRLINNLPDSIPNENIDRLRTLLEDIQIKISTDYLASGKLSANVFAVLKNTERQIIDNANALFHYGKDGESIDSTTAQNYKELALHITYKTTQIIHSRQAMSNYLGSVETILQSYKDLQKSVTYLQQLPFLGLMQEKVIFSEDFDESIIWESEQDELPYDRAESIKNYIYEAVQRYPKDILYTQEILLKQQDQDAQIHQVIKTFRTEMDEIQNLLATNREANAYIVLFLCVICLVVNGSLIFADYLFQRYTMIKPTIVLRKKFSELLKGNDVEEIPVDSKTSQFRDIAIFFNAFCQNHIHIEQQQRNTLDLVENTMNQTHQFLTHVVNDAVKTTQLVDDSLDAMDQVNNLSQEVNSSSNHVKNIARQTQSQMKLSKEQVNQFIQLSNDIGLFIKKTSTTINDLINSVNTVTDVLSVIREIAEQTNLLALNAAIEAARAGDHGRGFAVVASEVRELSRKTQDSVIEIADIISQLKNSSHQLNNEVGTLSSSSQQQMDLATDLLDVTEKVFQQAETSSSASEDSLLIVERQQQSLNKFMDMTKTVAERVSKTSSSATTIEADLMQQITLIKQSHASYYEDDQDQIEHFD